MSDMKTKNESHLDHDAGTIRGARAAPPQLSARECPIEAMYEEHFHQRQLCADMELLAATTHARPELARRILVNLCRDLPMHFDDEEKGLFPRLRARALPEDELDKTLNRLSREHEIAQAAFALLVPALACMADGALPASEDRDALCRLATSERRHLIVENAILLPLARLRLTEQDKSALMAEMCDRRAKPPRIDSACARALSRIDPARLGDQS